MKIIFALLIYFPTVVSASAPSFENTDAMITHAGHRHDVDLAANSATALFASGSASLSPAAKHAIAPLVMALRHSVTYRFRITGYSDSRGSRNYNQTLSLRRVTKVKDYLIELGVHPARIETMAFGEARAAINIQDTEALIRDRRVVIQIEIAPALASEHLAIGD